MTQRNPQKFLQVWLSARVARMRITNVRLAAAIERDEITVRRILNGDVRVDLERHLVPWQDLLELDDDELGQVWLQAHGLQVEVHLSPDALAEDDTPTQVHVARAARSLGELQERTAEVSCAGVATTAQVNEVTELAARHARLVRNVAGRVAAKVVRRVP